MRDVKDARLGSRIGLGGIEILRDNSLVELAHHRANSIPAKAASLQERRQLGLRLTAAVFGRVAHTLDRRDKTGSTLVVVATAL